MKKILLILLLFSGVNFVTAQQLSTFYDATSHNAGFSYNITLSFKLIKGWSKARPSEIYSVKLVSVTPDSRGFYYGNQRNKFYSCSEIGNKCNPNNWQQVYVGINSQCKTTTNDKLSFISIGEEKTIEHWTNENESCNFNAITATVGQDGTTVLMNIIDAKERSAENKNNTNNNNPTTQINSEKIQTNETKSHELKLSDIGISENNSSTTSEYKKNYETGQQLGTLAVGIADLFTPSPAEIQRRNELQRLTNERNEKIKQNCKSYYQSQLDTYLSKALKGDENARMTLCVELLNLDYTCRDLALLPNYIQWMKQAASNNNFYAVNQIGFSSFFGKNVLYDFGYTLNEGIAMLEESGNIGNKDAFLLLGIHFSRKKNSPFFGGANAEKAIYFFEKAAENGSYDAYYYLGMIYRHNFINKANVKFRTKKDDKVAFNYFYNALLNKDIQDSQFNVGLRQPYEYSYLNSNTIKQTCYEMAIMYEKGLGVEKDKIKADALNKIYDKS